MYFTKLKKYLFASSLLIISFSCELDDQFLDIPDAELNEEIFFDVLPISGSELENATNLRVSGNILHEINFNESNPLDDTNKQFSNAHSFKVIPNPLDPKDKSGKFELRIADRVQTATTKSARAEILLPAQTHNERWYAFSVFFPTEGYSTDRLVEIISQWHQAGGGSPPNSVEVRNDELYFRSINRNTTANGNAVYTNYPLGTIERGKWNEFVFHFVHASNQNGLIEVWQNGQKVHTIKGPNMRSGFSRPRLKIGIYKWLWNNGQKGGTSKRTLYYDNIKIGNENTTLSEISSHIIPSTSPTGNKNNVSGSLPEVFSLSLIAADEDKEIGVIKPGSPLTWSNNKLNIQANMDGNFNGQVKFALKGAYNVEFTDRIAPFTLFGDDGKGNYYFGKGLGPGNYTVTATPIEGDKVGRSKTISFVVSNNPAGGLHITHSQESNQNNHINKLPEIANFSLIAADVDKELGVITQRNNLSYKNHKLNIQANMDRTFNGHVKFELRGAYSLDYIDRTPPYSLFGDDGKGNYFFGKGLSPGTYTLTATPMNGKDIGQSKTISFAIRN